MELQYYARIKFVSAVAVGVLTGGISTLVGAGTFANHVAEARDFFARLWLAIEQLTGEPHQLLLSAPQTVAASSPAPAPVLFQTTTATYSPYGLVQDPSAAQQTQMTYSNSHVYASPLQASQLGLPPSQFQGGGFLHVAVAGPAPGAPMLMYNTAPPLPPRQSPSSWYQQTSSASSYLSSAWAGQY